MFGFKDQKQKTQSDALDDLAQETETLGANEAAEVGMVEKPKPIFILLHDLKAFCARHDVAAICVIDNTIVLKSAKVVEPGVYALDESRASEALHYELKES